MKAKKIHVENLWNSTTLTPPKFEFFESSEAIRTPVKQAINNEYSANKYRDLLFLEMVTLSKYLNQRRNKYRNDKGFKTIEKIEKAVNRVYHLDLKTAISLIKVNLSGTFVPSKQLCQWLLIKFQSHGKLLYRVMECCIYSSKMLNHRLRTGHNWIEIMIAMASVSRIWSLSRYLMRITCRSYKKLFFVVNDLPLHSSEKKWLPAQYIFPHHLEDWIKYNNFDILPSNDCRAVSDTQKNKTKKKILKTIARIKSSDDLEQFLVREQKIRSVSGKKDVSKNLDVLQWHMFTKQVEKWISKLRTADNKSHLLLHKILRKLRDWLT